jgi:hypothetical protein
MLAMALARLGIVIDFLNPTATFTPQRKPGALGVCVGEPYAGSVVFFGINDYRVCVVGFSDVHLGAGGSGWNGETSHEIDGMVLRIYAS